MLQAVDTLIDNGRRVKSITGAGSTQIINISRPYAETKQDCLNKRDKRVIYCGRSVLRLVNAKNVCPTREMAIMHSQCLN